MMDMSKTEKHMADMKRGMEEMIKKGKDMMDEKHKMEDGAMNMSMHDAMPHKVK